VILILKIVGIIYLILNFALMAQVVYKIMECKLEERKERKKQKK